MAYYGTIGSMRTLPGAREEVVAVLLEAADGLRAVGCRSYVVGVADDDEVTVWVTEVWASKQAHDDSLKLPEVRAAIGRAMPKLAGEFTRQEVTVLGGLGA
jgi:quinol monooxygenase YgiN